MPSLVFLRCALLGRVALEAALRFGSVLPRTGVPIEAATANTIAMASTRTDTRPISPLLNCPNLILTTFDVHEVCRLLVAAIVARRHTPSARVHRNMGEIRTSGRS